jgi:hypothetical protein
MKTHSEAKPESLLLAPQICPGFLLCDLCVSVVSIPAKQSQFDDGRSASGGRKAQNKASLGKRARDPGADYAKQSQFPPGDPMAVARAGCPGDPRPLAVVLLAGARAHATNCAKQTQFEDGPKEV